MVVDEMGGVSKNGEGNPIVKTPREILVKKNIKTKIHFFFFANNLSVMNPTIKPPEN